MESIDLKRPIMLKVIMTPEFRQQMIDEANTSIARLDDNITAIEQEGKDQLAELEESNPDKAQAMKQQMEADNEQLFQMKAELAWKIKEIENVEDGAELPFRVLEGSVQLKVGDDILNKLSKTEVVIKDWKVVEIRNP